MLKWIVVGLMFLNVGVFLSIGNQTGRSDPSRTVKQLGVNEQAMRLLSEIEVPQPTKSPHPQADENARSTENANDKPATTNVSVAHRSALKSTDLSILPSVDDKSTQSPERMYDEQKPTLMCYRVGPFANQQDVEQASIWMEHNNIISKPITGNTREIRAIRVFSGPFSDKQSLNRYVSELKIKQLQFEKMNREMEYYVYGNSASGFRISFGYFHQEELASQYLKDLQTIGIQAEREVNYETMGPLYWLEASVPIGLIRHLELHQWDDDKTKLKEIGC